ncbi:hypothetical protein [Haematomicrobium sanguinis]|uniref:hypothetical protein n=1 Tax=Haematomicrobium sanguinis TaxID=479106 RepID=UPI00047A3EE9|nr:hypothetical protein [Haematomicrobium sanguinis]
MNARNMGIKTAADALAVIGRLRGEPLEDRHATLRTFELMLKRVRPDPTNKDDELLRERLAIFLEGARFGGWSTRAREDGGAGE